MPLTGGNKTGTTGINDKNGNHIIIKAESDKIEYKTRVKVKLLISVSGMTLIQLEEMLSKRKVDGELLKDIKDVLSRSDYARFAPCQLDKEQLKYDYELSEKMIVKLQKIL